MRTSRILGPTVFVTTIAIAIVASCSSEGRHSNVDAPTGSGVDAAGSNHQFLDAPIAQADGIGKACTPGAGSGLNQGDCPTGYTCLALQSATHPWCSKTCTPGQGDTCNVGYRATGLAQCIYKVGPMGGPTTNYCGVMCEDDTSAHNFCPATQCTGACPSSPALTCSAPIQGTVGSGSATQVVAKACR